MRTRFRIPGAFMAVLALTLGLTSSVLASPTNSVRWTVEGSSAYTVQGNGGQPLVLYNDCLRTNTTYTINYTVTVDTDQQSYEAKFATVGETTQLFSAMSFDPETVSGAQGTSSHDASFTFTTGDTTFPRTNELPRERFGITLETADGLLDDSFLTVDIPCITSAATGGNQQDTMVTKTYALQLKGSAPQGNAFSVEVENTTAGTSDSIWICGSQDTDACKGDDSVYTVTRQYPQGTELTFTWTRWIPGDPEGNPFLTGSETLSADMTNQAWFDFGGKGGNTQGGQIPSKMPRTGAGGASSPALPAAAMVAFLALGAYSLRRVVKG